MDFLESLRTSPEVRARLQARKQANVDAEGFPVGERVRVVAGRWGGRRGAVTRVPTMPGYRYVTLDPRPREKTVKCCFIAIAEVRLESPVSPPVDHEGGARPSPTKERP